MGDPNRPQDGLEDDEHLDALPAETAAERFFYACLKLQANGMKKEATPAMKEASESRQFETVINIYGLLKNNIPELLNASPYFHVQYLKALRHTKQPSETIEEGERIFGEFVKNIPSLQTSFEQRLSGLREALADSQDDEDKERVQEETKELFRKWIYFFTQIKNVLEEILYASYLAQGRDAVADLDRWLGNFEEALNWFSRLTKSFLEKKQEHDFRTLIAQYELEIELRMWQFRLYARKWFYAKTTAEKRTLAQAISTGCSVVEKHVESIADPNNARFKIEEKTKNDELQMEERLAAALQKSPIIKIVMLEFERRMAEVECRAYEYKDGFEMTDEGLALTSLHESPQAREWVQEGVERCFKVMRVGAELKRQTPPEELRNELGEQLLGTSMRLNENLPKLGRFVEGCEWFSEAIHRARSRRNVKFEANAMNDFAWQNLVGLAKRLQSSRGTNNTTLNEQAKRIAQILKLPDARPLYLFEAALAYAEKAHEMVVESEPGQAVFMKETIIEICLSLLELPDCSTEKRQEWLTQAWDMLFTALQGNTRPDAREPETWSHLYIDAFARTLAFAETEDRPEIVRDKYRLDLLGIPHEAYINGLHFLFEDLAKKKQQASLCPPSYLEGLEQKALRAQAFVQSFQRPPDTNVSPPKFK